MGLEEFREFVLGELERSGASVSALARRAGVPSSALHRCLKCGGGASFVTVVKVLEALGWELEVVRRSD